MRIHFYSPNRIEPWSYRNVYEIGIGGSETSHVEMATRLARRGHEVTSYTELPPGEGGPWSGVDWKDLQDADFSAPGLWVIYRSPESAQRFVGTREELAARDQRLWLVCQDILYHQYTSQDAAKYERIIGLCPRHLQEMRIRDEANVSRLAVSSNGINAEQIAQTLQAAGPRNPKRLIWSSSPDRGLQELLDIFERARDWTPDLELRCFYGMDNIDKICGGDRTRMPWRTSWEVYERAQRMPGVTWVGRVGQPQLWREMAEAGLWCYPTWFQESSCISCMEAQALGCIPITNPIWATGYNVKHGWFIPGTPSDSLIRGRYVAAIGILCHNPQLAETCRTQMIPDALQRFSWENFAAQWDHWIQHPADDFFFPAA